MDETPALFASEVNELTMLLFVTSNVCLIELELEFPMERRGYTLSSQKQEKKKHASSSGVLGNKKPQVRACRAIFSFRRKFFVFK